MNEEKKSRYYKHLLCYDQSCFDGIEYGYTDIYFHIEDEKLFIRKVDHYQEKEKEMEFPIADKTLSTELIVRNFLIDLMSYSHNFAGEPFYIKSELFDEETFNTMLKTAIAIMKERKEKAIRENVKSEIIKLCKQYGLRPEPDDSINYWRANCPTGRPHQFQLSTEHKNWYCGYCKINGDVDTLRKMLEEKNTSIVK